MKMNSSFNHSWRTMPVMNFFILTTLASEYFVIILHDALTVSAPATIYIDLGNSIKFKLLLIRLLSVDPPPSAAYFGSIL